METVLVVAEHARYDEIKRLFPSGGYAFIRAESTKEARMKILDFQLSLAVVDAALPGGTSKEIAIFASSEDIDTILIVPDELSGHITHIMQKYGVYVVRPERISLAAVLSAITVSKVKIRKAEEKYMKLLERLRNEKLLTEAKCLLARRDGMSEKEAHSYLEKKAMDCRISLSDAALNIIRELS